MPERAEIEEMARQHAALEIRPRERLGKRTYFVMRSLRAGVFAVPPNKARSADLDEPS